METIIPLLLAAVVGFQHAFEADHLVAVSSIITKRSSIVLAVKDGIFWGLGHTSTILIIGILILVGKIVLPEQVFSYLEAGVGVMLVILGVYRFFKLFKYKNDHIHLIDDKGNHHLAYTVGAIHGLAGSGTMILLVMTEIKEIWSSIAYLLIFGLGSVVGMLIAAGMFSLPFSKQFANNKLIQLSLTAISSILCISLGFWVIYKNIYG
ncbi:MAG: urease accessory protein [Thermoflexibacter sp.]|jgi:high-affinity nickel permease|nr:urease accessory protein [Thermoflexibacter sp.]